MGKRKKKSEQLQGFGVEEHDGTLSIKTMSFNSLCRAAGREVRASDSKATTSHRNVYAYKERTEQVLCSEAGFFILPPATDTTSSFPPSKP